MGETVQATDGTMLPVNDLAQQIQYAGGFVASITVNYAGRSYVQTFTNDGTNIIFISRWVSNAVPPSEEIMTDESGNIMTDENGEIMITE